MTLDLICPSDFTVKPSAVSFSLTRVCTCETAYHAKVTTTCDDIIFLPCMAGSLRIPKHPDFRAPAPSRCWHAAWWTRRPYVSCHQPQWFRRSGTRQWSSWWCSWPLARLPIQQHATHATHRVSRGIQVQQMLIVAILNHTGNPVCFPRYFFHTRPSHSVWIAVGRRAAIFHVAAAALFSLAGNADGSTTVGNAIPGVEHVERTSLNQHFLNNWGESKKRTMLKSQNVNKDITGQRCPQKWV